MLLGRVPRADRLAIVRDVEAQIHEHLQEADSDDLDRDEVLAVLARLDPPEAYLPEEGDLEPVASRITVSPRTPRYARNGPEPMTGKAGGIVGICALVSLLGFPMSWFCAVASESEFVLYAGWGLTFLLTFAGGIVGLTLGIWSRPRGGLSITGIVTGAIALMASLLGGFFVVWVLLTSGI